MHPDGMYYDRQGRPIWAAAWSRLHSDFDYKIVAQNMVGDWKVSTVWLGLNHAFSPGGLLIFETMVFPADGPGREEYCERYTTETEACLGHGRALAWTLARIRLMTLQVVPDDLEQLARGRPGDTGNEKTG